MLLSIDKVTAVYVISFLNVMPFNIGIIIS